jgi:hypothetical protein
MQSAAEVRVLLLPRSSTFESKSRKILMATTTGFAAGADSGTRSQREVSLGTSVEVVTVASLQVESIAQEL